MEKELEHNPEMLPSLSWSSCPKNENGHEINWRTIRENDDGDETYIDAKCIHCGTSCCIGTVGRLNKEASWEDE